jgi:septal ring factor EnvC (AmiA/AmiB activator)
MFDSAIRYRDSRTFYSRGAGGVTVIAPRPSMAKDTPKISRDRARRARRQFEHDADAYWDEYERLASERRSTAVELARTRALFREIERRFQRYRAGRADTSEEPYIVVSEAAPLFLHKRLRDEIREGTVVWGRPHPDDSEWLQIQVGAVVYEVRGSHLWSQYQADRELSSRLAELEWELVEQEETREMLEAWDGYLRDLIQSGRRAAGVDSRERGGRAGVFLSGSGYEILDYSVDRCPDYAYEVVNESDMERLVKDWTKERDDLEKRLTQVGKEIVSIRRDTVRTEQRLRQFADRFQRFQQNGLNRGF